MDVAAELGRAKRLIQSAQFVEAEALLRGLLNESADAHSATEARYSLAVALRYRKDYPEALRALEALLAEESEHARAYQERGHTYLSLNQPADAAGAFARAVDLNPALLASWKALANLFRHAGRDDRARFAQNQADALALLPPDLLHVTDLIHEGKIYKAEKLCRRFLKAQPHAVEAMRLLADIGIRLRIYDDAEFLLESCVEFEPDNIRARSDYLKILNRKGKFQQAYEQAQKLAELQPDNPVYQLSLANALAGLGRFEEGIAGYQRCLAEAVNKAGVYLLLGHAQKATGLLESAIHSYREAYREKPDLGDAFWSLANTKTHRFADEEMKHMRHYESAPGVAGDDRIHFCFALGKAFEDRREYEDAFTSYQRGNALKQLKTGYDADKTHKMVREQIETCTQALFEQRGNLGTDVSAPIFIVGMPRAGSTLLEQILASHSQVDGTMELHNILGLAQRLRGRTVDEETQYPGILWELEDSYFYRFGEKFIEDTRVYRSGAPFFIDKMPNNFMHIALIRLILPHAKVIDARRDPMACCFSNFKQLYGEGQDFSYGLEPMGRYYGDYVAVMNHWDEVLPGFVLRVQHEDVLADLEGQVRRLLDFCGLPFEEQCLRFYETERAVRTPSSEQVRQPIFQTGKDQWRNFAQWLGPLREALGPGLVGSTDEIGD